MLARAARAARRRTSSGLPVRGTSFLTASRLRRPPRASTIESRADGGAASSALRRTLAASGPPIVWRAAAAGAARSLSGRNFASGLTASARPQSCSWAMKKAVTFLSRLPAAAARRTLLSISRSGFRSRPGDMDRQAVHGESGLGVVPGARRQDESAGPGQAGRAERDELGRERGRGGRGLAGEAIDDRTDPGLEVAGRRRGRALGENRPGTAYPGRPRNTTARARTAMDLFMGVSSRSL